MQQGEANGTYITSNYILANRDICDENEIFHFFKKI